MGTRYVAYGLQLDSAFRLPGMAPAVAGGLPPLALHLVTQSDLMSAWSGSGRSPLWTGRLGDGCDLRIDAGVGEDLLFSYGRRAHFRLDATRRSLMCAPRQIGLEWQRALLGKVLSSIAVMRGHEALHASAVESPQGVVAVLAPSGMGKTTLAIELMRRGWPLFADDVLVLAEHEGSVRAHPGTPHMNVAESEADDRIGRSLAVLAGEHWLAADVSAHEPRGVAMICLLERCSTLSLDAQPLAASPLPLAPYILGLQGDAERERRRFTLYANLTSSLSLVRLTGGDHDPPGALADLIEQSLSPARPAPAVGVPG